MAISGFVRLVGKRGTRLGDASFMGAHILRTEVLDFVLRKSLHQRIEKEDGNRLQHRSEAYSNLLTMG